MGMDVNKMEKNSNLQSQNNFEELFLAWKESRKISDEELEQKLKN